MIDWENYKKTAEDIFTTKTKDFYQIHILFRAYNSLSGGQKVSWSKVYFLQVHHPHPPSQLRALEAWSKELRAQSQRKLIEQTAQQREERNSFSALSLALSYSFINFIQQSIIHSLVNHGGGGVMLVFTSENINFLVIWTWDPLQNLYPISVKVGKNRGKINCEYNKW